MVESKIVVGPAVGLHPLEQRNLLKELVRANRTPRGFSPSKIRESDLSGWKEVVSCFVPPEGTKPEDVIEPSMEGGFIVKTPQGKFKGSCEMYIMTPIQADRIQKSIRNSLKKRRQRF